MKYDQIPRTTIQVAPGHLKPGLKFVFMLCHILEKINSNKKHVYDYMCNHFSFFSLFFLLFLSSVLALLSLFLSSSPPFLSSSTGLHRMEQEWEEKGRQKSMNWRLVEFLYFLFIWDHIIVQPSHQEPAVINQHVSKEFDWLISDRGPFHHSRSYLSFVERHRQGFTTRYKIYRYVDFLQSS